MMNGKELRRKKLELRDRLDKKQMEEKSEIIKESLLQLEEIKKALSIFIYVSFRSEVETTPTIEELIKLSKRVTVPITYVKEKRLDAIHIQDIAKDLVPGYCGIPEPKKDLCTSNVVRPDDIEVIILPGSVFDERGGRFGYGGGYYDRFLESNPKAIRIGLAFELQTVTEAPIKDHDEILDYVITEKRVIKGKR